MTLATASIAAAGNSGRFVKIASGETAGTEWAVGVARINGERCYALQTLSPESWGGTGQVCGGRGSGLSGADWHPVFGQGGEGSAAAISLNVTSKRVRTMNLLIAHPGGSEDPVWTRVQTHILNAKQAVISQVPRDFRFFVLTDPDNFCVEAIEAFDRAGNRLRDEQVPCEY
jgi:hypothetical protein